MCGCVAFSKCSARPGRQASSRSMPAMAQEEAPRPSKPPSRHCPHLPLPATHPLILPPFTCPPSLQPPPHTHMPTCARRQAVEVLIREVMPNLVELLPEEAAQGFMLHVVGANVVPDNLKRLFEQNKDTVQFHGYLPDDQVRSAGAAQQWAVGGWVGCCCGCTGL